MFTPTSSSTQTHQARLTGTGTPRVLEMQAEAIWGVTALPHSIQPMLGQLQPQWTLSHTDPTWRPMGHRKALDGIVTGTQGQRPRPHAHCPQRRLDG